MISFTEFLSNLVARQVSDIHLKLGRPPIYRMNGQLHVADADPIGMEDFDLLIGEILPERLHDRLLDSREIDFAWNCDGVGRFRVNYFYSHGEPTLALRYVKTYIPGFEELHLPGSLYKLSLAPRGIILLAGTTGSGKSTTLAAIIENINKNEFRRILTIEDPVEFMFTDRNSAISQREVGLDTDSFITGLKYSLRQDPDVIMIGEMRDKDSFEAALSAAETGHLILSTVHADNASQTISRILDFFLHDERDQIRLALASQLRAIVCQRLIPDVEGGIRPAVEIMTTSPLVKKLLRDNELDKLANAVTNGKDDGMQTFNQSLYRMIKDGRIKEEVGLRYASNPEELKMNLKGIFLNSTGTSR